jgi:NAD-dependent SIR2 family protein deacetylase
MPKLTRKYITERISQKRIAFFFGAGTSVEAGLPNMAGLTAQIQKELRGKNAKVYDAICRLIKDVPKDRINIERILDVSALLEKQLSTLTLKTEFPWSSKELAIFGEAARSIIGRTLSGVRESSYMNSFIQKLFHNRSSSAPVWIFTTNNDVLIEAALDKSSIGFRNGFVGYKKKNYDPCDLESDLNAKRGTLLSHPARLCKLHGSVTYGEDENGPFEDLCLPDRAEKKLMIFPSASKYEESHQTPFHDFHSLFQKILTQVDTLIVSGYSFSDRHLNLRLQAAVATNPKLTIFAFLGEVDGLISLFGKSKTVYGVGSASMVQSGVLQALPDELNDYWKTTKLLAFLGGR